MEQSTISLTAEQRQAAESNSELTVVISGPGGGKTKTLIERVIFLIRSGVDPQQIICITFTNAGASEMRERLEKVRQGYFEDKPVRLGFVGTLHSFLLKLLRQTGKFASVSVLTDQQRTELIDQAIETSGWKGSREAVETAITLGPLAYRGKARLDKVGLAAAAYFQAMREEGALDFDSILHYGFELLNTMPSDLAFEHLLVDESQDSSDLDFKIYRILPIPNKFYVGDGDQSIFSFRKGDPSHLTSLASSESGALVVKLEDNFRCGSNICRVANMLIRRNTGRVDKQTTSATGRAGSVEILQMQTAAVEGAAIAQAINCPTREADTTVAVLLRTNALVRQYRDLLEAAGVKVFRAERPEVPQDWTLALAAINLAANPYSDLTALRFVTAKQGAEAATSLKHRAAKQMKPVIKLLAAEHLFDIGQLKFDALAGQVTALGLMAGLSVDSQSRLLDLVVTLEDSSTLADLCLAAARERGKLPESTPEFAIVTTIHQSKGREFDWVFLPAFEQRIIPSSRSLATLSQVEEERRLAFVGFTRAKSRLVISYCRERQTEWQPRPVVAEPSQFIYEAGFSLQSQ